MADAAKRLVGPASLTNSAADLYTVPAATTTIVRDITVANVTGSAATFFLSIGADAAGTRLFGGASIPANTTVQMTCFHVLEAAETIQGYSGTNAALTLTVGGIETT